MTLIQKDPKIAIKSHFTHNWNTAQLYLKNFYTIHKAFCKEERTVIQSLIQISNLKLYQYV